MGPVPKCDFAPKFSKLKPMQLWKPITLCENLQLRWGLKQSCSPRQYISNNMWHNTYMQLNQNDYQLLVVGSQIGNLTPNPSFGHNLCLKIWESIKISNSQNGSSLGSVKVHSLTLSHTPRSMKCDSRTSLMAHTFASPCFGREPKARVATMVTTKHFSIHLIKNARSC